MSDTHSVRVRTESNRSSTAQTRATSFAIGRPVSFGHLDPAPSAFDTFLGAIGAEVGGTFLQAARPHGVEPYSTEVLVRATLDNPLAVIGAVGEEGQPSISNLDVVLYVVSDARTEIVNEIGQTAIRRCPILQTIRKSTPIAFRIESS